MLMLSFLGGANEIRAISTSPGRHSGRRLPPEAFVMLSVLHAVLPSLLDIWSSNSSIAILSKLT
jgi:hypothetical protein